MDEDEPQAEPVEEAPYVRPGLRSEEVFESLALTCNKADSAQCEDQPDIGSLRS